MSSPVARADSSSPVSLPEGSPLLISSPSTESCRRARVEMGKTEKMFMEIGEGLKFLKKFESAVEATSQAKEASVRKAAAAFKRALPGSSEEAREAVTPASEAPPVEVCLKGAKELEDIYSSLMSSKFSLP